jgi:hypothetical protein
MAYAMCFEKWGVRRSEVYTCVMIIDISIQVIGAKVASYVGSEMLSQQVCATKKHASGNVRKHKLRPLKGLQILNEVKNEFVRRYLSVNYFLNGQI